VSPGEYLKCWLMSAVARKKRWRQAWVLPASLQVYGSREGDRNLATYSGQAGGLRGCIPDWQEAVARQEGAHKPELASVQAVSMDSKSHPAPPHPARPACLEHQRSCSGE